MSEGGAVVQGYSDTIRVRVTQVYEMDVAQDVKFENGVTTVWPNVPAMLAGVNETALKRVTFEVVPKVVSDDAGSKEG